MINININLSFKVKLIEILFISGTCKSHEFSCANGQCRQHSVRCDAVNDCGDRSDEMNCTAGELLEICCKNLVI